MTETKKRKRWPYVLAIRLALLLAGCWLVGDYFYNYAIASVSGDQFEYRPPEGAGGESQEFPTSDFFETADIQDVFIQTSHDGLSLHGSVVESPGSRLWAVIVHGYSSNGLSMASFAESFSGFGYNLLLPDLRGHGESQGDYRGMGWHDRLDLIDWINYINDSYGDTTIVLFGISMGGAAVMMASGEESLPSNVAAVIEDCGYSSIYEEFRYQLDRLFGLPAFPVLNLAGLVTDIKAGFNFVGEGDVLEQLSRSDTPTLFIHGSEDDFVPYYMLDLVYEAAACEKEKLTIDGAIHGTASVQNPELYWTTVADFLTKYTGHKASYLPLSPAA